MSSNFYRNKLQDVFFNSRTLADVFAFRFLLVNKHLFIVYPFDELEKVYKGTSKSKQRWEQCILHLSGNYGPALQALYAERYFNKEVQESALDFIKEVVRDIIGEVKNLDINEDAKLDVVKKLNTAHYIIGYPEEVLDLEKIKKFYDKLELNGTEGIVETYLKIESFNENIKNRPKSNWKKKLIEWSLQQEIKYYTDDNIICELKWNVS